MKVTDSKNVSSINKAKKSNKAKRVGGPSFDSMVEKASQVERTEAAVPTSNIMVDNFSIANETVPDDAQGRGHYLLDALEEFEKDILLGKDSAALERLRVALQTQAIDIDQVPQKLREVLDEIDMRASIELAKAESNE